MKVIPLFLFLALLLAAGCSPENNRSFHVYVVHSYEPDNKAYHDFNRLIDKEFGKHHMKVDIRTSYLDCENYTNQNELAYMRAILDTAAIFAPDIILVNDDQATYSLMACGHPLAYEVPIVFAGVNYPNWEMIRKFPNATGFHDKIDFMKNYEMIHEVTHSRPVFIIADSTFLDMKIRNDINELARANPGQEPDIAMLQMRTPSMNNRFSNMLWMLSKMSENHHYLQCKRDFTVNNIPKFMQRPSFSAIYEGFGYGETILGGYLSTIPELVREEVGAAVKILRGTSPADIPITESAKEYVIDYDALDIYDLELKDFDTRKYKFVNITLAERYPVPFYTIVGFLSVLLILSTFFSLRMYIKEVRQRLKLTSQLEDERESLTMSISESGSHAWRLVDGTMVFDEVFWLPRPGIANTNKLSPREFESFVHPDDIHTGKNSFLLKDKGTYQFRADFSGKYEWWELRYSVLHPKEDDRRILGMLINVQSFKDHERELEEAKELAEKAELKQSFLANMSHEIRTPLNAIVGFSNLLAEDGDGESLEPEERKQFVDQINLNNDLLLKLVNDILELSRMESGNMIFEMEDVSVTNLIREVYGQHAILSPGYLRFSYEILSSTSDVVFADKTRLAQVLTNFLNNAFKFTKQGNVKIGCATLSESSEVELYVQDTGIGIDKEHQKIIFDRFYKRDEFAQGTGLGLSICSVIAIKMHGRIALSSEPGKGSRFSIILPLRHYTL